MVPSPPVFTYVTNWALVGNTKEKYLIWEVDVTEHVVQSVLRFMSACRDGVPWSSLVDRRLPEAYGVL